MRHRGFLRRRRRCARGAAKWRAGLGADEWRRHAGDLARALADGLRGGRWGVEPPARVGRQRWAAVDALRGLGAALGCRGQDLAAVVRGELGPRWLRALRAALAGDAVEAADVGLWYCEWRERLLGDQGRSRRPRGGAGAPAGAEGTRRPAAAAGAGARRARGRAGVRPRHALAVRSGVRI